MGAHRRFKFSSIGDLRAELEKMELYLPLADDTAILQQPLRIGKNIIPNRMVVHPMEGCDGDPDGKPAELTRRRYIRFAEGGAGLVWFEATAIVAEGRANPRQLLINKDTLKDLGALLQEALNAAVNKNERCRPQTLYRCSANPLRKVQQAHRKAPADYCSHQSLS